MDRYEPITCWQPYKCLAQSNEPMTAPEGHISQQDLIACHCCGLVQQLPEIPKHHHARCPRCHSGIKRRQGTPHICMSFALTGAMLYPFAIFLPIMKVDQLGHQHTSSIWSGCEQLLSNGYWLTGLIVVTCSIILPICKLLGLILICRKTFLQQRHKVKTYHFIELTGRWGMLDVMLVAVLVAIVKIGSTINIHAGVGLSVFCICVVLSLCASAFYDPHMIWKNNNEQS